MKGKGARAAWALVSALCAFGCNDAGSELAVGTDAGSELAVSGVFTVSPDASPFAECDEPEVALRAGRIQPSLAVDPTDPQRMAAAWAVVGDEEDRGIAFAVSRDGGTTWESSAVPGFSDCRNGYSREPWITAGANGDLYVMATSFTFGAHDVFHFEPPRLEVSRSRDWGRTWEPPEAVDANPTHGALFPHPTEACTLHATYEADARGEERPFVFARSTDCGATWARQELSLRAQTPNVGRVVTLSDGTLLVLSSQWGVRLNPRGLVARRSIDGGATWSSPPLLIAQSESFGVETPDPSLPAESSLGGLLEVAHDPATDRLFVVFEDRLETDLVTGVFFAASSDGGLSWSPPIRIDATPAHDDARMEQAFLPAIAVAGDGTIGVLYLSFQNDLAGDPQSHVDAYLTRCAPRADDCRGPRPGARRRFG